MRLIVGNCTNGMTPMTLLNRISVKSVKQQRHELPEVLGADDVAGDGVAHEAVGLLGHPLPLARHDRELAGDGEEEPRDDGHRDHHDERRTGDGPVARVAADDGPPEVLGAGGLEALRRLRRRRCRPAASVREPRSGSQPLLGECTGSLDGRPGERDVRYPTLAGRRDGRAQGVIGAAHRVSSGPVGGLVVDRGRGPGAARASRRPARRSSRRGRRRPGPRRRPSRRP